MTIIGSGNWGSAIAKIVGRNVLGRDEFDDEVDDFDDDDENSEAAEDSGD